MRNRRLLAAAALLVLAAGTLRSAYRITDDKDLKEIDLSQWDCLNRPGGTAKTDDGVARNHGKNRPFQDVSRLRVPDLNTAGFLKMVTAFDARTKEARREDLTGAQIAQVASLEKQIVSLTGYLVLAYAGPPETTNCGSVDFHDWHLEVFEKPADHPPRPGDLTPIICEITPRTAESALPRRHPSRGTGRLHASAQWRAGLDRQSAAQDSPHRLSPVGR